MVEAFSLVYDKARSSSGPVKDAASSSSSSVFGRAFHKLRKSATAKPSSSSSKAASNDLLLDEENLSEHMTLVTAATIGSRSMVAADLQVPARPPRVPTNKIPDESSIAAASYPPASPAGGKARPSYGSIKKRSILRGGKDSSSSSKKEIHIPFGLPNVPQQREILVAPLLVEPPVLDIQQDLAMSPEALARRPSLSSIPSLASFVTKSSHASSSCRSSHYSLHSSFSNADSASRTSRTTTTNSNFKNKIRQKSNTPILEFDEGLGDIFQALMEKSNATTAKYQNKQQQPQQQPNREIQWDGPAVLQSDNAVRSSDQVDKYLPARQASELTAVSGYCATEEWGCSNAIPVRVKRASSRRSGLTRSNSDGELSALSGTMSYTSSNDHLPPMASLGYSNHTSRGTYGCVVEESSEDEGEAAAPVPSICVMSSPRQPRRRNSGENSSSDGEQQQEDPAVKALGAALTGMLLNKGGGTAPKIPVRSKDMPTKRPIRKKSFDEAEEEHPKVTAAAPKRPQRRPSNDGHSSSDDEAAAATPVITKQGLIGKILSEESPAPTASTASLSMSDSDTELSADFVIHIPDKKSKRQRRKKKLNIKATPPPPPPPDRIDSPPRAPRSSRQRGEPSSAGLVLPRRTLSPKL